MAVGQVVLHMVAAEEDSLVEGRHTAVVEGTGGRRRAAVEERHMEAVEEGNLAAHHMALAEEGTIVGGEDTVVVRKVGQGILDSDQFMLLNV